MGRLLRRLTFLAIIAGVAFALLKRAGLIDGCECGFACACSSGATQCRCGHKTCLAPAPDI